MFPHPQALCLIEETELTDAGGCVGEEGWPWGKGRRHRSSSHRPGNADSFLLSTEAQGALSISFFAIANSNPYGKVVRALHFGARKLSFFFAILLHGKSTKRKRYNTEDRNERGL